MVRLSIISIALAVTTMEVALSVVQGFQTEIQNKVVGFGSHVQIGNYYREEDSEVEQEAVLDVERPRSIPMSSLR